VFSFVSVTFPRQWCTTSSIDLPTSFSNSIISRRYQSRFHVTHLIIFT
jgi:hypothetical protein